MKENGKKIIGVISDILLILILVIAIVITVMTFTSKNSDAGIGNVFGYTPFSIQSDSMAPTFKSGDLIISREVKNVNELQPGDVITYSTVLTDENGRSVRGFNTHRIIAIEYNKDNTIRAFATKGDGIDSEDNTLVLPDEVIAKQVNSGVDENGNYKEGLMISNFGMALNFLQSRTGFMVCIIIPLALFFIWQIYKLIAMFMEAKAQDIDEETKKRAIEEYLAEQAAKQKAESGDGPTE
ncbi:MAG: signal peptidase I [Clostridia bacterium]|nr:signal peptidase I [Clostridia bacterium]